MRKLFAAFLVTVILLGGDLIWPRVGADEHVLRIVVALHGSLLNGFSGT